MGEYRAARSVGGADLGDGGGVAAELVGGDEVFVDGLYRLLQLCNLLLGGVVEGDAVFIGKLLDIGLVVRLQGLGAELGGLGGGLLG